jgi:hypothetical protein
MAMAMAMAMEASLVNQVKSGWVGAVLGAAKAGRGRG